MSEGFAVLMAAVISAFVAVVGLVITKESKISEFRQQWIDGLRADVSALIGAVTANQIRHTDYSTYRDIELRLQELRCRIELRFHLGDETAVPLLRAVADLIAYGGEMNNPVPPPHLYTLTKSVKDETQTILKNEWERVKAGEKSYCRTLRVSKVGAVVATSLLILYLSVHFWSVVCVPFIEWMVSVFKG